MYKTNYCGDHFIVSSVSLVNSRRMVSIDFPENLSLVKLWKMVFRHALCGKFCTNTWRGFLELCSVYGGSESQNGENLFDSNFKGIYQFCNKLFLICAMITLKSENINKYILPNQLSSTKYSYQYTLIILCKFQSQFSIKSPLIKCFLLKNRRMIEQSDIVQCCRPNH